MLLHHVCHYNCRFFIASWDRYTILYYTILLTERYILSSYSSDDTKIASFQTGRRLDRERESVIVNFVFFNHWGLLFIINTMSGVLQGTNKINNIWRLYLLFVLFLFSISSSSICIPFQFTFTLVTFLSHNPNFQYNF